MQIHTISLKKNYPSRVCSMNGKNDDIGVTKDYFLQTLFMGEGVDETYVNGGVDQWILMGKGWGGFLLNRYIYIYGERDRDAYLYTYMSEITPIQRLKAAPVYIDVVHTREVGGLRCESPSIFPSLPVPIARFQEEICSGS